MDGGARRAACVCPLVLLGCAVMTWVEAGLRPVYPIKSALKVLIFLGCVGLYVLLCGDQTPLRALRPPRRRALRTALALAAAVFAVILGGYALLAPWLDLSAVTGNLGAKEGVTAATFPFVALYISLGNSFLEEFFFRGFAFLTLRAAGRPQLAWIFSALAFALYHVAIMDGWFHPALFLLLTAALAAAGLLFNWLDREGSLWPAWLVHMGANLAINTIGLRLFGII